ncbi:MAG: LysE family translocator [Bacteroidia bacterium]|jgi:threonine/homoserine/homoserine lactone efflux protein|nr:LysE family translocator [Bacteroidia bacterium]
MLSAIGQGMILGLALSFMLGPAFFGLIQTSLRYGYRSGIAMAGGIFLSDLIYLLLTYFGISKIILDPKYAIVVGLTGGVLLIGYGLAQIIRKPQMQSIENGENSEPVLPTVGTMVLKGFLMNMFNPFVIILWMGAFSLASKNLEFDPLRIFFFFTATLLTILSSDILKSLAAGRIKLYLNETIIHKINIIAGLILLISGAVLIVRLFVEQPWNNP